MMNFTNMNLQSGQELRVVTKSGRFSGNFEILSCNGTLLTINNTKSETGKSCGRFKRFLNSEVVEIEVFSGEPTSQLTTDSIAQQESEFSTLATALTPDQLNHIKEMSKDYKFINEPGSRYFDALADISKQLIIGLASEGIENERIYTPTLLTISTSETIYIFDLMALRETINDLKEILERGSHLKVLFNSCGLKHSLNSKFTVGLKHVFDLKQAAKQFHPESQMESLQACIKTILGIDYEITEQLAFPYRPIADETLKMIADKAALLLAMYHRLVQMNFEGEFRHRYREAPTLSSSVLSFFDSLMVNGEQPAVN